jgi:hypothetical protein
MPSSRTCSPPLPRSPTQRSTPLRPHPPSPPRVPRPPTRAPAAAPGAAPNPTCLVGRPASVASSMTATSRSRRSVCASSGSWAAAEIASSMSPVKFLAGLDSVSPSLTSHPDWPQPPDLALPKPFWSFTFTTRAIHNPPPSLPHCTLPIALPLTLTSSRPYRLSRCLPLPAPSQCR